MSELQHLLQLIDEAYDRRSWHGTNLRGSIRGLDLDTLTWRPGPGRHNIWEVTVHAAYWKYVAWRRLHGATRGSFPLAGSDWFARPAAGSEDAAAWKRDLALLEAMHRQLRGEVAGTRAARLAAPLEGRRAGGAPGTPLTAGALIRGIAAHDLYHAGQIQLLKRLSGLTRARRA
jgi:hypothetical protein